MNFSAALIYFVLFVILSTSAETICKTPNGSIGDCIVVQECDVIYNVVKTPESVSLTRDKAIEIVRQLNCGYQGKDPKICCPRQNTDKNNESIDQNNQSTTENNQSTVKKTEQTSQSINEEQSVAIKISSTGLKISSFGGDNQQFGVNNNNAQGFRPINNGQAPRPIISNGLTNNNGQGFRPINNNGLSNNNNQGLRPFGNIGQSNNNGQGFPINNDDQESESSYQTVSASQSTNSINVEITQSSSNNPFLPNSIDIKLEAISQKIKLLPDGCGKSLQYKYFVGNNTELDDFPWLAILEYQTPLGRRKGCGGVLINSRYVLTAAHCVIGLQSKWRLVSVNLGKYNINANHDCMQDSDAGDIICSEPKLIPIEEQIVHPEYTESNGNRLNDIALLRLAAPVSSTKFIDSICLPFKTPIPQTYLASGWGKTLYNDGNNKKRMSTMTLREQQECAVQGLHLSKNQFCANAKLVENTCIPDEGGPLMGIEEKNDRSRRTTVFGILSYIRSPNSYICATNNSPAVYTNVLEYVPWILNWIKE